MERTGRRPQHDVVRRRRRRGRGRPLSGLRNAEEVVASGGDDVVKQATDMVRAARGTHGTVLPPKGHVGLYCWFSKEASEEDCTDCTVYYVKCCGNAKSCRSHQIREQSKNS